MNAVGIDVSKGKSMVAALRPFGEIVAKPFEVPHTSSGFHQLVDQLNSLDGSTRIIMEHTVGIRHPKLADQEKQRVVLHVARTLLYGKYHLVAVAAQGRPPS
mgnify:CR=1 FL=1